MDRLHQRLLDVLEPAVTSGEIPGAVAIAGASDAACEPVVLGVRRLDGPPVTADTRYDLASLTKVVATLPSVLRLIGDGALSLDDRVGDHLSNAGWFQTPSLADVPIRALLTHTSGLPGWAPLFARSSDPRVTLAAVLQSELPHSAGRVRYSDLGFLLLGALVHRASRTPLDAFVRERVTGPLGMRDTGFGPVRSGPVAATEDCGWRMRLLQGEVHDENAWAMGGVAGHAGLFGTAADLALYAQAWLRRDERLADPALLETATRRQTPEDGPTRGFGWVLAGPGGARPDADGEEPELDWRGAHGFGHSGFTGTSLWIDPEADRFVVLLANRVHPTRRGGTGIARVRREVHAAALGRAA